MTTSAAPASRFLTALMRHVDVPVELLGRPGTSVVDTADRAGSGMVVHYRVGCHSLVWGDGALIDSFVDLAHEHDTVSPHEFEERCRSLGFVLRGDGVMKVLPTGTIERPAPPDGYRHERLSVGDVERVRALCERCDDADVEEAALDELDDYREIAINVLTAGPEADICAYASATPGWAWDVGFADIGVLVRADHRQRGLGRWVVAHVVADLLDDGHLPLYRHAIGNAGSDAVSTGLGFEPVASLQAWWRTTGA